MNFKRWIRRRKLPGRRRIWPWILAVVCLLAGIYAGAFRAVWVTMPGTAMEPTIADGSRLLVDRRVSSFVRNDIIVFEPDREKNIYRCSRILAVGGDHVQIKNKYVWLNGKETGISLEENPGRLSEPVTLKEGEYLVLNDRRSNTNDSRLSSIGVISQSKIVGKVWGRLWPNPTLSLH